MSHAEPSVLIVDDERVFDPDAVDAFSALGDEFVTIARTYTA